VATRAVLEDAHDPLGPRYRLTGNKMWISSGEHEMTENIVHLVLAKIPGADGKPLPGVKGISLFIVPKKLVNARTAHRRAQRRGAGRPEPQAGLARHHQHAAQFWRRPFPVDGKPGAVGYLVGQPGEGLRCMFHMMNEARIAIGMAATMLGLAGYEASLDYARTRVQGRPVGAAGKDASQPQVRLIEHADVRRMLLAQKATCEGALALLLYCAPGRRAAHRHARGRRRGAPAAGGADPHRQELAQRVVLEANSLAIQIHGGYGYTRDFPVEQYWRDNRLNMIHEGTHGIQAMDLLGRKVRMEGGRGLALLAARVQATIERRRRTTACIGTPPRWPRRWSASARSRAAWAGGDASEALANAVPYMQAFGHVVLAWIWLDVALAAIATKSKLTGQV
jgi:butyryl-CoA dehydrogenase